MRQAPVPFCEPLLQLLRVLRSSRALRPACKLCCESVAGGAWHPLLRCHPPHCCPAAPRRFRRRAADQHGAGARRGSGQRHRPHAAAVGPGGAHGSRGRHRPPICKVGAGAVGRGNLCSAPTLPVQHCSGGGSACMHWRSLCAGPSHRLGVPEGSAAAPRPPPCACSLDRRMPEPPLPAALLRGRVLRELAVSSPPAFICHYYNHYFAHTGGCCLCLPSSSAAGCRGARRMFVGMAAGPPARLSCTFEGPACGPPCPQPAAA